MAQDVFISYASADKAVADRVCAALENAGASCWIAPRNIEPGRDFPAAIVEAVNSVRVLVLILTDHAAASPHILSEVGHAFNGKKRIIPFRLSPGALSEDLGYFLSTTQWLDAPDGCTDQNLKRLTEATLAALAGERPPPQSLRSKRPARWVAAAIVTLAVVGGAILYWKSSKSPGRNTQSSTAATAPSSAVPAAAPTTIPAATPPSAPAPRTSVNPLDGQKYVWIPPGTFTMGCSAADDECKDDEKPAHPVTIEKGFWLGQTEVTVAAYRKVAAQHALQSPGVQSPRDGALPVSDVSWMDARKYCAAIGGRLPTEAEWEYAARGGTSQPYYGVISKIAWYAHTSGGAPHAVGKKEPNAFGLYDMLGNVAEWVLDRYFNRYSVDSPATGAGVELPLASNALAVARGGFWGSDAASIRVSHRSAWEKEGADIPVGFRCASDRP
jgi:formylglycine-generating enzyme required for sulfatase activity